MVAAGIGVPRWGTQPQYTNLFYPNPTNINLGLLHFDISSFDPLTNASVPSFNRPDGTVISLPYSGSVSGWCPQLGSASIANFVGLILLMVGQFVGLILFLVAIFLCRRSRAGPRLALAGGLWMMAGFVLGAILWTVWAAYFFGNSCGFPPCYGDLAYTALQPSRVLDIGWGFGLVTCGLFMTVVIAAAFIGVACGGWGPPPPPPTKRELDAAAAAATGAVSTHPAMAQPPH